MKPSALRILGALQHGPQTNKALLVLAGFRYGARVAELRRAGHVIAVSAPGPTPGVRLYRLDIPARRDGEEVDNAQLPPGADVHEEAQG